MAFDHLPLPQRISSGGYKSPYGKEGNLSVVMLPSDQTTFNKEQRAEHGANLRDKSSRIINEWITDFEERSSLQLPPIPEAVPVFLQVDPKIFSSDSLKTFGIEVISEESNGFVIGASADLNMSTLAEKIEKFINEDGKYKNTAAQLWDVVGGKQWRIENILSKELFEKWALIDDAEILVIDIAIACYIQMPGSFPERQEEDLDKQIAKETDVEYQVRLVRWEAKQLKIEAKRDELSFQRQDELEEFIKGYAGEIISSYVNSTDSFSCRLKLCGKGLRDLLYNYPYLFEVEEYDDLEQQFSEYELTAGLSEFEVVPPNFDDPKICIIDSGIQEEHRFLSPAINNDHSFSYVKDEEDVTSDQVTGGGHGTRVAGSALFPNFPFDMDRFKAWIQNARVLNSDNKLDDSLYPAELMEKILTDYHTGLGTRIFNLSINKQQGHFKTRMSKWAESIDRQIWDNDVSFIVSAGNLSVESLNIKRPGILEYKVQNINYPDYLTDKRSRVADPAHSLFSITVGSICSGQYEDSDLISFGKINYPSSFSRSGLGIWDSIKPELVEYGGDFVYEKNQDYPNISQKEETSLNLLRSTLNGGPAYSADGIGTSFSAPKVAHIISVLEKQFPDESSLLYKALLIQSARWPDIAFTRKPSMNFLRLYGFGIPSLERATQNSDYRVTLVNSSSISPKQADVYEVKIPKEIRKHGDAYDILIEVTLTFKANPRRTRTGFRSYLSGRVDWQSSLFGESIDTFKERIILDEIDETQVESDETDTIPWVVGSRSNAGINGVKLNQSATQKDWAIVKSNRLTSSFCIGVIGHIGWEKDLRHELPYSIAISFEALNKDIEIYNRIRLENRIDVRITTE